MFKINILVFSLLGLLGVCAGQFVQFGQCNPDVVLVDNFDVEQFLGTWYEIARTDSQNHNGDCASIEVTRNNDTINIYGSAVNNNFFEEVSGTLVHENGTAKLTLNISVFDGPLDFWMLMVDYEHLAVAFSCENISNNQRRVYIWQLGRATFYPNELMPALINIALNNTFGISSSELRTVDHSETACYILPVIGPGESVVLSGQCDNNITVVQNFNVSRFVGVWHEISSYYSENALGTCARAEYSIGDGVVNVLNSQVLNQTLDTISGYATVTSDDLSAKLTVVLNIAPNVTASQELWILATDYDNFGISYTCVNINSNQKRVYSWIISRTRQLNPNVANEVQAVIDSIIDLNVQYYQESDQSDAGCFYYPEPVPNQPVVFRGQCDLSIPAMPNFDPSRYMGLWHDIESYPTAFQDGTCNNAFYTLVNGTVDVFNTQVINQTLDTIDAVAVLASTDGSAKLLVTFPVAGTNLTVTTDYWVLDTDYISYALVYSCNNINADQMQVTSWKLSRTKQLSTAAAGAINNVTNTIPVLEQRYYQARDQSLEACFYFPEPQEGIPVVFPGSCDQNVTTVQNFNFTAFQGVWYEIQAYPKDQQSGQCINHQFNFVNNILLNMTSSNVYDQFLYTNEGTVFFTSNNSDAKLTIRINVNGSDIDIPYWILGTDYNDYAFAYSCVDINEDFRAVYSWKLSRTKELSTVAVSIINNAIANNVVLDNDYYEDIDQSDQACFNLPELAPGEPIILPGQCDTNISGVQNFNAARYLGRWRLIEGYPSDSQNGTCEEANYSLADDGSVTVFNTEVINQELVTITGRAVLASNDSTGKLLVTFPDVPVPFEYYILETDYDSYALVYGCVNINAQQRRIWSWKMSRDSTLSQTANAEINRVISGVEVLNNRYYETVDRSGAACFYYPTPDSTTPVRFRTQCEDVAVVTDFDAVAYMGLWHDIESYPQLFQFGSCPNAFYTLVGGTVDVFNTQVINQTLDTINGVAVLATTDGSAKLNVTFNVGGFDVTTNYWVLATDYLNYALVYSCQRVDDDYVQVASWKLSRTKTLSANATAAINNTMSSVAVLDQRYYVDQDQSPGGCFYYPVPQPGVPVVFPGQCDTNITAVPNFNASQFQGIWYEIEAYPKVDQPGQCISHQFNVSSTGLFDLQSSSVDDSALGITYSNVTFDTNDGSGRLVITLSVNGSDVVIPYWILSTDYQNYALAYSCVNIDSDYRGVWSWKLSRTRELTNNSAAAINNTITDVYVLDNAYYEPVYHTEESCFYLPELAPGEPVIFPGQCDQNISAMPNFNATRYLGRWFLIESYPSEFQRGTCNDATYTLGADGTVVVFNTEVVNQTLDTITGSAVVASVDGSGKLLVTFPDAPFPLDYWIIDTDYETYALVYSCANIDSNQRQVWSWKMSRTGSLSQTATASINQAMTNVNVLHNRYFYEVDRSSAACFYFPTPDSSTTVRFRGQCNESIPVVTGFDAVRYMGLWHDIESYPQPFQFGSCPNAFYTLVGGTVDVFNTQVINQTLDTLDGSAVLATTDGSAKLNVTFNVAGFNVTSNYWVLATDYDNYAFVYSCQSIDDEYILISSWKLSRTKSLSANATTDISNIMNTIPVLNQSYFVEQDQSEEGCFYFPEPQPGVPVVFPGQCDNNITAIPNFNMSQFQGLWYEIEAYPKDEQPGQCISHQFDFLGTTSYNLESSSVNNLTLEITNSNVTIVSIDGSGRLSISISVNGSAIVIPYWILSTDYSNYALAYSCVNIDNDYRGVWSWKLSRTKQLNNAAITNINNAISNVNVLDNMYYEPISQTDESCFYLPDLAPGESVIFPGQCDQNITAISNFNAARYLGRWFLIETYPSAFQQGTCSDATYSLGADGTVVVFNTEVVNQTLDTITGSAVVASTDGTGKLLVTFPNAPAPIEYWILDTDYETFAFVYSCVNLNSDQRQVWSWKMSRTGSLSQNATGVINQIMDNINVLDNRYYYEMDRSAAACFYFPTPDNSTTVRFRGECDENIPVVTGFDPTRYTGLWHDIESYPAPFQDGTCPNAYYTLVNGVVDVFNTQVLNQTLDTINGFAVLASADGSAKLSVTFNVSGIIITTNYWVLATDYDSYALVYSCSNLNDEYKTVQSWKLSRTKALTSTAVTVIANVTSNIDILDQRYYVSRDQSSEGCFYFPEPIAGEPVVFPGQCDNSIAAIPNFNMSGFQGLWHEIEAYPKEEQPGQCINHQFTLQASTQLTVQSSNVFNQNLDISSGTVTFAANDGSGRLTINITVNGTTISIPYWILSTDYDNYALAYSCVNINSDYRGVWSWKLSRTKQLSGPSNTAINNAVANIDVLDNQYYETISQTDESCFYLPDLAPGEPVTFIGQCDQNITVMQNFDAARYLGRWRLVETYPSEFQVGTCSEATYTLANDGTIIVYNTEVVNETRSEMYGSGVLAGNDGSAKLIVTFPDAPEPIEYWILDTDYESYTLVYSCANLNSERRRVWSWKMSRTNSLSQNAIAAINQVVDRINVLDSRYYEVVDRSDEGCFYYPEPTLNTSIVFRGQCDQNISVVSNFNATRYAGSWYDVASYPMFFQTGTCPQALYNLRDDGTVEVINTQVSNQILETWYGTAVLASTDGSAKLDVTFNVNGFNVTTNYWVLATDYDSYSLVYSCRNIDDYYREVFSWKLSRQPTLSGTANTNINSTISNVQVLGQQYYIERGHTDEDCFYYPDNFGGDVILNGECVADSEVQAVTGFYPTAFSGTWHEVSRFPSTLQDDECVATEYSLSTSNTFAVTHTTVNSERLNSAATVATVINATRGVISADIDGVPFNRIYILATDYTEYALAYGCRNLGNSSKQIYSWKLSRSRAGLSTTANNVIDTVVSKNIDLFEGYYRSTDQSNDACFYYPVFDPLPESIVLPTPCNESIRGVANFDAASYLGRWIEIAKYPEVQQQGECHRAEYSLGADVVDVTNTQVINETLLTQLGSAVVASTDGTGLLSVTFVVNGLTVVANYYVLATDYDNYALVYSCRNLTDGRRQVSSWKLSRTTALSAQANSVIDTVINGTQGLTEEYYVTTSQSDEDCFYVPEVNANQAPVFRGQCENISGVQGFDAQRYLGWWHEIERYPSDRNVGECISSQYSASGDAYQVVDTSVSGGVSAVVTGTVTVTNDGRLRRTLSDGRVEDVWVLATDYETYSLLYWCENVNVEYRRVWSAKHSKIRSLTQSAQNVMTPVIANNRVLYPQFYQPVNQSDAACFFYPTHAGDQIVIPGQCDQNIPVVQSFEVSDFAGTWYQIERYDTVQSTCVGTRLTVDEASGSITVIDYEVVDEELNIVEGTATVASSDGSGRLSVVMPTAGNDTVTTSLYILDTDYETYALTYSCTNVNSFQRAVRAWKLSRSRTMSSNGNTAINTLITQRQELHQPYFKEISQSEECEEPSSAYLVKSSIIVMLVCVLLQLVM